MCSKRALGPFCWDDPEVLVPQDPHERSFTSPGREAKARRGCASSIGQHRPGNRIGFHAPRDVAGKPLLSSWSDCDHLPESAHHPHAQGVGRFVDDGDRSSTSIEIPVLKGCVDRKHSQVDRCLGGSRGSPKVGGRNASPQKQGRCDCKNEDLFQRAPPFYTYYSIFIQKSQLPKHSNQNPNAQTPQRFNTLIFQHPNSPIL